MSSVRFKSFGMKIQSEIGYQCINSITKIPSKTEDIGKKRFIISLTPTMKAAITPNSIMGMFPLLINSFITLNSFKLLSSFSSTPPVTYFKVSKSPHLLPISI